MEIIFVKLWGWIQPHASLLVGTVLHGLFTYKLEEGTEVPKKTFIAWIVILVISLLLGIFFDFMTVAYYAAQSVEASDEIRVAARVIGAFIGFPGMIWIINKLKSWADEAFHAVIGIGKSNKTKKQFNKNKYNQPVDQGYEDGPQDR